MPRPRARRRARSRLARLLPVALLVAGCAAGTSPATSPGAPPAGPAISPAGSAASTTPAQSPANPSPNASLPAQADTSWGRIWEDLPATFPRPAGAEPTEVGGTEPTSATLDVPASAGTAEDVVSFYRSALGSAGYSVSVDGPLENGGYTISAAGSGGCATQLSVAPLGGSLTVTVLYGAKCPFD
jgi:hypothetical protein